MPGAPTSAPGHLARSASSEGRGGDELWTRAFLMVFGCLSGLIAALLAYFYFQRPENLASVQLEDALIRSERAGLALCLYQAKAMQYNVRLLIALRFLGMFVGAQCILLGALFLLKGIETNYQFHLHAERASSSINTSSPGLVLITLGTVLVALTQFHDQDLAASSLPSCGAGAGPAAAGVGAPAPRAAAPDGGATEPDAAAPDSAPSSAVADGGAAVAGAVNAPERSSKHSRQNKTRRHESHL